MSGRSSTVRSGSNQSDLSREIGQLADLPRTDLVVHWHRIYRCPPPKGVKRGLLERAIAWHLQARHFGGMSPSVKRQLKEAVGSLVASNRCKINDTCDAGVVDREVEASTCAADSIADSAPATPPAPSPGSLAPAPLTPPSASHTLSSPAPMSLTPGSRLVREWHGKAHHVDVIEEGFVFEGKTYASLSAIAREITGARWSGPRFFGV
ncbi:MAG: DUF2924 domain-containing protein [Nitratireductor sp.]